jgi:gamma-glutamyltranspeptidase/glutathione hydrolase
MRHFISLCLMSLLAVPNVASSQSKQTRSVGTWQASGRRGAVAAGGQEAVDAGLVILRSGGNAADAAAATILALSVTDSGSFCFGGEVPILVFDARRGVVEVLCGQGAAPRLATREYFVKRGGIPGRGLEAAAVPGALDACLTLLDRHGTRTFAEVVASTVRLLDRHQKEWHSVLAKTLRRLVEAEKLSPTDRNRGLRLVADYFYRGPIAHELDSWCREHGGLIRYSDLATHVTRVEEPVHVEYRGYTVYKCGPWTQGPYVLEALRLLEGYDLKALGHNRPDAIHVTLEAMKLGLADRDTYYGDPLFVQVPMQELLSPSYAALRRSLIDMRHASLARRPGDPAAGKALLNGEPTQRGLGGPAHDTTTCVVGDSRGNIVAATPSGWSGVLAGPTGIWLGSRLQSFNLWEGHPNCIEPGKRPRITLTPTLVLKSARPMGERGVLVPRELMAVSVAGGDGQDQTTLQLLLNLIDFGMNPAEAVTAPRFGTGHFVGSFRQSPPALGSLSLNPEVGDRTIEELRARGHKITLQPGPFWAPCVLTIDPQSGMIRAAGDPRTGRHAEGY